MKIEKGPWRVSGAQLSALRRALAEEAKFQTHEIEIEALPCVLRALAARDMAIELSGSFFLTDEGRDRATLPADFIPGDSTAEKNPSLLDHWRPE